MLNPASLGGACWCILENRRTYPAASSSQDRFSTRFIHTQARSDTQGIRLRGKSQKLETTERCMVRVPKITRSPAGSRRGGCPAQRGRREEARCCLDKGPPATAVTKKSNNKKKSELGRIDGEREVALRWVAEELEMLKVKAPGAGRRRSKAAVPCHPSRSPATSPSFG